jgi:hypothetical protein
MRQQCDKCGRGYNDDYHSTVCPHKGIGFCAVCDGTICVCTEDTAGDWERSSANMKAAEQ